MNGRFVTAMVTAWMLTSSISAAQGYKPPRTADGRPDLQGIWQVVNAAAWDIQDHSARLGVPAGRGVVEGNEIPYQPWALAKKQENLANRAKLDPDTKCHLPATRTCWRRDGPTGEPEMTPGVIFRFT